MEPARAPLDARSPRAIGVPLPGQADPDEPAAILAWEEARAHASDIAEVVAVDVGPLLEAAPLLYDAWVAERTADLGDLVAGVPDGLDPTVASIIAAGAELSAAAVFEAMHRLAALRHAAAPIWDQVDALLLPTAPVHPTLEQVAADPFGVNARIGRFTNFANLMDLAVLALPGAPRRDGLPFGVSLLAPRMEDRRLLELGARWSAEPPAISGPPAISSRPGSPSRASSRSPSRVPTCAGCRSTHS